MSEWNHEQSIALINAYERKPQLWDCNNKDYHLRNKKYDAWIELAEEMNSDSEVVKNKMTSLLSSFRRER